MFSAAHSLLIRGEREPVHGHDWRVTAVIEGPSLDEDGLLVDFHAVERTLDEILAPYRNSNLNESPPFDEVNPSAERVAEHIARRLDERLPSTTTRIASVAVTEAPGCEATFLPGSDQ